LKKGGGGGGWDVGGGEKGGEQESNSFRAVLEETNHLRGPAEGKRGGYCRRVNGVRG